MKVVILAAGVGTRLKIIWQDKPKPLFEIWGKNLLEYSLDALDKIGIKDVIIVVGYEKEQVKQKIGESYKNIKIEYAENNIYETTGSMHSVYAAFEGKEPDDCIVLDADLIYDPEAMAEFINSEKKDSAFLTTPCGSGDETFVVLDEADRIDYLRLKKNEDSKLLEGKKLWEFNGVAKFSKEFLRKMFEIHEKFMKEGKANEYYEECALEVRREIPLYGFVNPNFVLAEIDRPKDIHLVDKLLNSLEQNQK